MNDTLLAQINDKARRTVDKNIPAALGFLDPTECACAEAELKRMNARYFFSGGYEGAERCFAFILPDYMEEENFPISDYITAFSARVPFGTPTHRDFLGAILGLGLERECVGDILVSDETTILVDRKIAQFILDNLNKVGRLGVFLNEIELSDIKTVDEEFDEVSATVASLRLDAALAAAFRVSRTIAARAINAGAVCKNWIACQNTDESLSEGDLISWRGHGRARLHRIGGTSKKGRQFVNFKVYVKK